jgi:hypothetical protein
MNFGYTTKGGSTLVTGKFFASRFICPDAGILNSVSVYLKNASGVAQNIQIGIYNDAAGAIGTALIYSATLSLPIGFDDWRTVSLAGNLLLGGAYWLTVQLENSASIVYLYYDAGTADQGAFKEAWTFGDWTDNPAGLTYSTNKISISAAYTYVNPNSYTWFQQPKSQIDPEKVEEAITRLILEHEQDEESHLGAGESLQSHKASVIIDHVVDSVVADKLGPGSVQVRALNVIYVNSTPMQMEGCYRGVSGSATITDPATDIGIFIQTGTTINSVANLFAEGMYEKNQTWNKERLWKAAMWLGSLSAQVFRFGIGYMANDAVHARHVGFRLTNGSLVATVGNGTVESLLPLPAPAGTNTYYYKIHFLPGVSAEFFIDGVSYGKITVNLPSGTIDPWITFQAYLTNTAAANKLMQIFGYEFQQNL